MDVEKYIILHNFKELQRVLYFIRRASSVTYFSTVLDSGFRCFLGSILEICKGLDVVLYVWLDTCGIAEWGGLVNCFNLNKIHLFVKVLYPFLEAIIL